MKIFQRTGETLRLAQTVPDIELGTVESLVFSPDSTLLLTGHYKDIRAWRLGREVWEPEATFTPHHDLVRDMAFSLDGTRLAIAGRSDTNAFGLWAVKGVGSSPTGALLTLLQGRVSSAQKRFLDDALAGRILSAITAADAAPRDMFETEEEYGRAGPGQDPGCQCVAGGDGKTLLRGTYDGEGRPLRGLRAAAGAGHLRHRRAHLHLQIHGYRGDAEAGARPGQGNCTRTGRGRACAPCARNRPKGRHTPISGSPFPRRASAPLVFRRTRSPGRSSTATAPSFPRSRVGPDLLLRNVSIQGVFPPCTVPMPITPSGR